MHAALVLAMAVGAGRAEKTLEARVSVSFISTPFLRCVEELQDRTGTPFVVDRRHLDLSVLRHPVTLRLEKTRAREILDWLVKYVGAGYEFDESVVVVTSYAAAMRAQVVLKRYDVRDITSVIPDFPGPDFALTARPHVPATSSIAITFSSEADTVTASSLAEMIQSRVRPDSWAAELGTSIEERGARLYVMQTPEVHAEIKRLLDELRREATRMISVHVEEMVVPYPAVRKAVSESGSHLLTRTAADELRTKAIGVKSVSILCFDGQRASSHGGRMRSIVADYDVSGGVYEPVVRAVRTGLSVETVPCLSGDGKGIMLTLVVRSCEEPEIVPFRPIEGLAGGAAEEHANVPGVVQLPRRKVTGFSSVFELPLGRSAFFSAGKGTRGFLVTAEVVRP